MTTLVSPRGLSVLADRACIGVGQLILGDEADSQLLKDGLTFCKGASQFLERNRDAQHEGEAGESISVSLVHKGNVTAAADADYDLKSALDLCGSVRSRLEALTQDEVLEPPGLEDLWADLDTLARLFYRAEITSLKQLREKHRLQAYG